mmetsp:Transcript_2991/g.7451  ORF Transcript_2991/g.7451 Transcript_2991/m.7451 type:complete len:247 (+) Transcript_2991:506-1246(+)
MDLNLVDVAHGVVRVQRHLERHGLRAPVVHPHVDRHAARREVDLVARKELVRPHGARVVVVAQLEHRERAVAQEGEPPAPLGRLLLDVHALPPHVAREAMLLHLAGPELREAQRDATRDGLAAVEHRVGAHEEDILPARHVARHARAVAVDLDLFLGEAVVEVHGVFEHGVVGHPVGDDDLAGHVLCPQRRHPPARRSPRSGPARLPAPFQRVPADAPHPVQEGGPHEGHGRLAAQGRCCQEPKAR